MSVTIPAWSIFIALYLAYLAGYMVRAYHDHLEMKRRREQWLGKPIANTDALIEALTRHIS